MLNLMRVSTFQIGFFLAASAGVLAGCRYDPVQAEKIRALPLEDAEGPRPEHRAGQPCVDCHSTYAGAQPQLAIGGTVYWQTAKGYLNGMDGVFVTIQDSAGATYKSCTNSAGNFYITKSDLQGIDDLAFPLIVGVAGVKMNSLIGRERSCAGCHKLASVDRIDRDPNVDPATGRARDSAGAIIVDRDYISSLERCGIANEPSTSTGTGGAGGNSAATTASGAGGMAATTASGAGGMAVTTAGAGGATSSATGTGVGGTSAASGAGGNL